MFLAHIHNCLLDIAQQAFLYYHTFCLKYAKDIERMQEERASFLRNQDIHGCDQDIVRYLAEVVKLQQVDAFAKLCGYSEGTGGRAG
mgnify:CR=1 FL=1